MPTMNISLPDPMKDFIEAEVATGSYGSVSGYIRELVHEAQTRRANEKLHRLLMEGMNSGTPIEATAEFWSDLRNDVANRIAEHKRRHGRT